MNDHRRGAIRTLADGSGFGFACACGFARSYRGPTAWDDAQHDAVAHGAGLALRPRRRDTPSGARS